MASENKIRVAMLSFAHVHARGYARQAQQNPRVELVAVWDEPEYGGKQAAEELGLEFYSDLDALLSREDVDGVIVNAPTSMHAEVMIPAARAGKHIFTEKALAVTLADCDRIIAAVQEAGVQFMISLPQRCNPNVLFAKKAIEDGLLGELTFGRARGAHSGALDRWFGGPSAWFADRKRAGGGGLFDLGCHQMDILPWLMGGDPRRVTAIINNFSNAYPIDDNSATLIEFDSKAIGVVDVSWVHRSGFNMVELYGTEGSIAWGHGGFHFQTRKLDDAGRERYLQQRPAGLPSPFEQWVNAILDGAPTTITIQDGRNLTELLQAAYRSAESGQAVVLPLES